MCDSKNFVMVSVSICDFFFIEVDLITELLESRLGTLLCGRRRDIESPRGGLQKGYTLEQRHNLI